MNRDFRKGFIIVLIIILGGFLYHFFGWRTYQSKDFTLSYPNTWEHKSNLDGRVNPVNEIWYITDISANNGAGKCLLVDGQCVVENLFLSIYPSSDPSLNGDKNIYQEIQQSSGGDFANMNTREISLPNINTQGIAYLGGIWVKPVEHNGKIYSFSGTNTLNTIKILSSFKFTD